MKRAPNRGIVVALLLGSVLVAGCQELEPDRPNINFGKILVGLTSGPQSVHWTNNHPSADANIVTATTQPPYAILNAGVIAAQTVKPGNNSPALQVTFAPTEARVYNEEVHMVSTGVRGVKVQMTGEGVWAVNSGFFTLQNNPPNIVGSFDFSTYPIQPNQPIDWGTKQVGAPATEAFFRIVNAGAAVNGTLNIQLAKGNQHFRISFPGAPMQTNVGAGGAREIRVEFNPVAVGDWWDIVMVTDTANPGNFAMIIVKAKVVPGE